MASRYWLSLAVMLAPLVPAVADDAAAPKAEPVDPKIIQIYLMDGSMVTGKLSVEDIKVETKFGTLSVPIESIRRFTPGLQSHPELTSEVKGLIEKLGSEDYDERESAQQELLRMGEPLRPVLTAHRDDADKERRDRIRTILDELDSSGDETDSAQKTEWLVPHDLVETNEFTAIGKIVTPEFTVTTNYGPLKVKLSDVKRGERPSDIVANVEKKLDVLGTHLVQRGTLATGIRVKRGDTISITADGSIVMTPWGNGATSSPNGEAKFGWLVPNSIPGGMLVATIGTNADYLKVGSRATIKATRSGELRLGVAMQPEHSSNQFPGGYRVKVVVDRN